MQDIFIPLLLGTGRDERRSEPVAKYLFEKLQKLPGVRAEFVDVRDISNPLTMPSWQPTERTAHWRELVAKADGLLVVTPEYNRGYPGELKIAIDALDKEYKRKAVAIAGVSSGIFGGTRVILALRQVFVYLGMQPISAEMNFGNSKTLFDAEGKITDPSYGERIDKALEEFVWLTRAMKTAREADPAKK